MKVDHPTLPPPTISVIIPTLNDGPALLCLLERLAGMPITEIIIVDGSGRAAVTSDNIQKPGLPTIVRISSPKGRGIQIAHGLKRAASDYLWVLHADSYPHTQSPDAICQILANPRNALGCFSLRFDSPRFWLRLYAFCARFDSSMTTFGDQGFFFRRKDYVALALNLAAFPLLEDWVLRKYLKRKGRVRKSSYAIITSARRFERYGVVRTQMKNAAILWQYIRGISPDQLYHIYYQIDTQHAPRMQSETHGEANSKATLTPPLQALTPNQAQLRPAQHRL